MFINHPDTLELDRAITRIASHSEARILQIRLNIDEIDPLRIYHHFSGAGASGFFWTQPVEHSSFYAHGELLGVRRTGPERFTELQSAYDSLRQQIILPEDVSAAQRPLLVFCSTFFPEASRDIWAEFSPGLLYLPSWMVYTDEEGTTLDVNLPMDQLHDQQSIEAHIDDIVSVVRTTGTSTHLHAPISFQPYSFNGQSSHWRQISTQGLRQIRSNRLKKLVLSEKSTIPLPGEGPLFATLDFLRTHYPNCVSFAYRQAGGKEFFGATPEWLARVHDGTIFCDALAGSAQRSVDPAADRSLEESLLRSAKNHHEHQIVVDFLIKTLSPFVENLCFPGSPVVQKLENVQHLYTPVQGELSPDVPLFSVIDSLHPTPAVGGIPRDDACHFIRELEGYERGMYASPVGWLSHSRTMDIAVGLRSGLRTHEAVHLFAGAGLVDDSRIQAEYDEIMLKYLPLLSALNIPVVHE